MKFKELASRNLKEVYRDKVALGFLMGMPLAFILIFGWAFGGEMSPASIGVVQQDKSPEATAFVEVLSYVEANPPEGMPPFDLIAYGSEEAALKDLKLGKLTAFVIVPEGFGEAVEKGVTVPLTLLYDENDPMAAPRAVPVVREVAVSFLGVKIPLALESRGTMVEVENEFMNFFVPGMTVFGLMILVPTMVRVMAQDKERGFLSRLLTFPFRPLDFILGYSLPFIPIIALQVAIYTGVGVLMGLRIIGNFGIAFLLFILIGLCCVGIAMIIASLVKSEAQGEPACWVFLVPLAMLSGAWFSIEMMPPILIDIVNVLPFIHALDASRQVITTGAAFTDILPHFYWLVGWAIALFAIGALVFRRSMRA